MHKVKANALWNKLTVEQRATLDKWLFEEKMGYAVAWQRARQEMGFTGSVGSMYRYYRRRENERVTTEFKDLRDDVVAIRNAPGDAASTRDATTKVLGQFLFRRVRECPDKVKEWAPVADLMVRNEYNEIVREAKAREHQIRENALEFAKQKFQVDMVEQALGALPELHELERARRAAVPNAYVENAHLNRARRKMFGVVWEVRPESPEEEAAMLAAKREREAREKAEQEAGAAREERITEPQPPTPGSPYYQEYLAWQAKREAERQEKEKAYQESLEKAKECDGEKARETNAASPRKPSKQYQEYLDKLKQWEEKREILGWEEVPRPEWSGRWPMTEDDEQ